MTFEELAEAIMKLPKKKREMEARVYCSDHAEADGSYTCSLQNWKHPAIYANVEEEVDED